MNDEFKKLDAFMQEHAPGLHSGLKPLPKTKSTFKWPQFALLGSLFGIILTVFVMNHQSFQKENTLALSESLEYEIPTDDLTVIDDYIMLAEATR